MAKLRAESLFSPALLVLDYTEAGASDPADTLSLGSLDGLVAWRIYRPDLAAAETGFARCVEELLRDLRVLPGRFRLSLEGLSSPSSSSSRCPAKEADMIVQLRYDLCARLGKPVWRG